MADVYELAGLSRRTSDDMARGCGQSVARWHVLSALSEEPLTCSAVARRLGLARQSVQRVVDALAGDGLLGPLANETDRRSPLLCLTNEGQRTARTLFAASEAARRRQLEAAHVLEQDMVQAQVVIQKLIVAIHDGTTG